MDVFVYSARAVIPLLLPIALGWFLSRRLPWPDQFFAKLNSLAFKILLPLQLFLTSYKVTPGTGLNWRALIYEELALLASIWLGVFLARFVSENRLQRGTFAHAFYRSNSAIMGIPLVAALTSLPEAEAFLSVSLSIVVPTMNIVAVILLSLYSGNREQIRFGTLIKKVITNPLVIGTLLGVICSAVRSRLPVTDGLPVFSLRYSLPALYKTMESLSAAASPVMLLALGGQLDFRASRPLIPKIAAGVFARLVIVPTVFLGLAILLRGYLGLSTVEMPALVAFFCAPVAVSSVVMVQEIGGDSLYASQLVVWTSAFSMITIFLFVAGVRFLGLL